jgi:cytochrome c oxidase cbb3-type subunit 2
VLLALAIGLVGGPAPGSLGAATRSDVARRGAEVYAAHCAVCHGPGGDGAGMAAHVLEGQPRDFRRGLFKFRSTPSGSLPTDADLLWTVTEGLRWTAMIGRSDLSGSDRRAVVQHVKTFAPRFAAEPPGQPVAVPSPAGGDAAAIARGELVYQDAGCAACHGERGRGDGVSAAGLRDDWGWPSWVGDLTWRPLKRGFAPEGLHLTIATGLAGTPMPSYGDALDARDIRALVAYMDSLVPPERWLSPAQAVGEERRGWMALRMGRMMGGGMGHRR